MKKTTLLCLSLYIYSQITFATDTESKSEIVAKPDPNEKVEDKDKDLPLSKSPLEKLTFSTTEGSWLSLDVSSDGQTIIFDLLGDLYTLPIKGGTATRLTHGLAFDAQPVFSPNGDKIAYISDQNGANNLWIANRDGSEPLQLSDEKYANMISPEWTVDGEAIVVTRDAPKGPELVLYDIDGGSGVVLSGKNDKEKIEGVGASFSPDGKWLYYASSIGAEWEEIPATQVKRLNMSSGELQQLTQGNGGGIKPVISPNGEYLVFGTRYEAKTGLRLRHLTSQTESWLAYPVQRDNQENFRPSSRGLLPSYSFTPDSKAVIFNVDGGFSKVDISSKELSTIPFSIDVEIDIGPDVTSPYKVASGDVQATIAHTPQVSNAGTQIASSILTRIYIANVEDATNPRPITPTSMRAFEPTWSHDDQWLAFVSWDDIKGGHIYKMRADGRGQPQKISKHPAFYTDVTFSADGKKLYAMKGNAFQRHQTFSEFTGLGIDTQLISLPSWGGEDTVLALTHPAIDPHVRQVDANIYLFDNSTGELYSVREDGSEKRILATIKGPNGNRGDEPLPAERALIHPSRNLVVSLVNEQVWLTKLPHTAGSKPEIVLPSSSLPSVKLTDTGADFIGWNHAKNNVMWAIGNQVFQRSLDDITFREKDDDDENSVQQANKEEEDSDVQTSEDAVANNSEDKASPRLEDNDSVSSFSFIVTMPRDKPEGSILLKGANVITMAGDNMTTMTNILYDHDVLIEDNRIKSIGKNLAAPSHAKTVDLSGKFILPGFIDTHAHWEFRTQDVLEPHNWSLAANLAYGVTSGLDVQTSYYDYFTYRDMVETGQIVGQRAFMTGPGVFGNNDFSSYEQVEAYLKRYSEHYRTKNIKAYTSGNRKQRQWVIQASKKLGLMPTTEGAADQKMDLTHAIDGFHGNEHNMPDTPLFKDVITLYAQTKTAYTPTLIVQYNSIAGREYFFTREKDLHGNPRLQRFYPHNQLDNLVNRRPIWAVDSEFNLIQGAKDVASIQRAGGLVGVGGHAEFQGLGYHWEMWAFALGGMTPGEILKAATIDGARIIGISEDLGSIEVGKLADMVILNQNPLEDIRHSVDTYRVMQNGRLYDPMTLNQLLPEQKTFPPFWWWE